MSEVKNFLPRLVLIRAKVGAIALNGRSTFVSETKNVPGVADQHAPRPRDGGRP